MEGRVAKLRQQLQEAEVKEALERAKGTMHGISSPDAKDNPHLGPMIYSEVQLEGIPVQALLDTGSPATIVSLEFLIEARWKTKPPHLTREKWEEDFKKKLKSPEITLQNYGGDRLNVVGQTQVAISRGDYSQMAVVQVQKGAPVPLLIGTNLQLQLGFLFLQCTIGGMATNLLDRQCVQVITPSDLSPSQGGVHTLSQPEAQPTATVHLLHAVRVPAQHSRLIQAKIEGNKSTRQVYFGAAQNELAKRGLTVEDGMVEPNPDGNIALAIQNHSLSPVHLEENQQLGRIEDAVILSIKGEANEEGSASVATQVKAISQNSGRGIEEIKEALGINSLQLAQEDKDQLLELVDDYSDIFALDQSELGHTHIVTHTIDTGDLVHKSCLVYLDDILVIGRTFTEHLNNLVKVFSRLRQAGLRLKPSKCCLARTEVEYLGHVVSQGGVAAHPKKVEAVQAYPAPTNLKNLRSFLGLASYYRRFIPNFSSVARPLHILTRKNVQFDWTRECQKAFDTLKKLLTQAPLLAYPDFTQPFMLETDASVEGLGAVLAQRKPDQSVHPIAYASRTLLPHERNYGISELEGLGVVWAVKTFRHYLYGHKCHVYTDHEALKALIHAPHPSGKLARWGLALQELDFQIHYRPGKQNANADALSRAPIQSSPDRPFGIIAMLTTDGPQA